MSNTAGGWFTNTNLAAITAIAYRHCLPPLLTTATATTLPSLLTASPYRHCIQPLLNATATANY